MHPRTSALVAFSDAEIDSARSRRIAAHLQNCAACQAELQRIESEKDGLASWGGTPPRVDFKRGLATVLAAVAQWRQAAPPEMKSRLRARIELYFGAGAAGLAERPDIRADQLLANSLELMAAFLGHDAAETVIHDVLRGLDCAALTAEGSR